MDIIETIREYGEVFYVITFVLTFFEGETFVIFAGLAAEQGILRLDVLIACAWLGSFCGDQLYFAIGRRWGHRVVERFPRIKPSVNRAMAWLSRYNTWFILSFRFVYVVRNVSSFAMGMSTLSWPRFLVLNFIAAGLWATSFAGAGYLFGKAIESALGDAARGFGLVMLALFMVAIWLTLRVERRRRAARASTIATPRSAE